MSVVIIGAGLGGLYLANLLHQNHIPFKLYDQASALETVGGGLDIWGNGYLALQQLNHFDASIKPLARALTQQRISKANGELLQQGGFDAFYQQVDAPFVPIARAQLQQALLQPIHRYLYVNSRMLSYQYIGNKVEVSFANGDKTRCDWLFAADGAKSCVRQQLFAQTGPESSGFIWAGGINKILRCIPDTLEMIFSPKNIAGLRPLADDSVYWFFCHKAAATTLREIEDIKQYFSELCKNWHSDAERIITTTQPQHVFCVQAQHMPPLKTWGAKQLAFIGDSAHVITPVMGQSASLAFEDAYVWFKMMRAINFDINNTAWLAEYSQQRRARCQAVYSRDQANYRNLLSSDAEVFNDSMRFIASNSVATSMDYMRDIIQASPFVNANR